MEENIVVSISCITYNHANYIRDALEGFLMQKTNFRYEILIHDDASTDGTKEIIEEYQRQYSELIKPLYEEENQWVKGRRGSAVFNFPRAKGKYIALCEGDDYWTDPLKLQKQVDFLEENKDYVITYSDSILVNSNLKQISNSEVGEKNCKDFSRTELKSGAWISTRTICFRNTLKIFPYEFSKVLHADTFLISLLGQYGKGKYLKEIEKSVYRIHGGGLYSNQKTFNHAFSKYKTYKTLYNYYQKQNDFEICKILKNKILFFSNRTLYESVQQKKYTTLLIGAKIYFKEHQAWKAYHKLIYLIKSIIKYMIE